MCGRFTLRAPADAIAEEFGLVELPDLAPRFNIAPTQPVAVVREIPSAILKGQEISPPPRRELVFLHWGLVPSWADDPAIGNRLINARVEGVAEKPSFRAAFRRRRCLVVADGFYEWQKIGRAKQPFFFRLRGDHPFGFAGLWEYWEGPGHSALESCTILTTEANDLVRAVHDRMPVIVPPDQYARWLDPAIAHAEQVASILTPHPSGEMESFAVCARVNSPAVDDADCLKPADVNGLFPAAQDSEPASRNRH
jgi:putative SOS response-associated peptidase YedK